MKIPTLGIKELPLPQYLFCARHYFNYLINIILCNPHNNPVSVRVMVENREYTLKNLSENSVIMCLKMKDSYTAPRNRKAGGERGKNRETGAQRKEKGKCPVSIDKTRDWGND